LSAIYLSSERANSIAENYTDWLILKLTDNLYLFSGKRDWFRFSELNDILLNLVQIVVRLGGFSDTVEKVKNLYQF
jgi:hypothetical protein